MLLISVLFCSLMHCLFISMTLPQYICAFSCFLLVIDFLFHNVVVGKYNCYNFNLLKFIDLFYGLLSILQNVPCATE